MRILGSRSSLPAPVIRPEVVADTRACQDRVATSHIKSVFRDRLVDEPTGIPTSRSEVFARLAIERRQHSGARTINHDLWRHLPTEQSSRRRRVLVLIAEVVTEVCHGAVDRQFPGIVSESPLEAEELRLREVAPPMVRTPVRGRQTIAQVVALRWFRKTLQVHPQRIVNPILVAVLVDLPSQHMTIPNASKVDHSWSSSEERHPISETRACEQINITHYPL